MQNPVSVRIPDEIINKVSDIATHTGRTKSYIIVKALEQYVERELWQVEQISQSIKEADNNEFVSDDELAKFGKRLESK